MPRELTFNALIPGCSIQDFYAIACSDTRAITQFHRDVSKDESACCSTWSARSTATADADGQQQRLVEFTLAMAIPATVQRFVGAGPIRIKETQQLSWLDGGATIRIVSVPELQIAYAKALKTAAELLIRETSAGVQIDVAVQVNASVPWPMQGTVEALMADQARKTVGQYVVYIGRYVEAALEEMNNQRKQQQYPPSPAALQPVAGPAEQHVEGPPTPAESADAAVAAAPPALTAATPLPPPPAAAVAVTALVPAGAPAAAAALPAHQQQQLVPAGAVVPAAAAEPADVFYDASEVLAGSGLDLLLRELREERAERLEANRLLASISASVQRLDQAVTRELAFQEGVRYAEQRMAITNSSSSSNAASSSSNYTPTSLFLSVAVAAAAASAATALVLTRRAAAK